MDNEREEYKQYTRPEDSEDVKNTHDNGTDKSENVKIKSFKEEDKESENVNASLEASGECQTLIGEEPSQSDDNNKKDTEDHKISFKDKCNFYESNDNAAQKDQSRQSQSNSTAQKVGSSQLNQAIYKTKIKSSDGSKEENVKFIVKETKDNGTNPRCNFKRKYLKYIVLACGMLLTIGLMIIVILCYTTKQQETFEEEQFSGPQNDPFFATAFPQKGSTVIIKCFLSFQGKYTLHTIFEKENKNSNVSDICSKGDAKHHYKIYCDKNYKTGCKDSTVCRNNCAEFNISLSKMEFILLEMDDSCLALNGRIEIWNSSMKFNR